MTSLADFETLLQQSMGLHAISVGSTTVERAVKQRMEARGLAVSEYMDLLRGSNEELQELIETVVVPETWFFRDPESFVSMVRLLTEERMAHAPFDPVRLLSIPCSTGEEPYSMVMALLDAGFSRNQIKVDAIDISGRALAHAKRGIYGSNSFRGKGIEYRERYFRPVSRGHGNGHGLIETVLDLVTFQSGNLVSNQFSRPATPYDVIFCRNLLIYFDRPTQESVMKTLGSLLSPTGFLFVGPAEAHLAASCGFTSVNRAMSFAFRQGPAKSSEGPAIPLDRAPKRLKQNPGFTDLAALKHIRTRKETSPSLAPANTAGSDLAEARRLADLGRLQEAIACCERNLKAHGPSAETCYLLGVVRAAAGDLAGAAELYRRVVYLDPEHIEALMHLAVLTETQGDPITAKRLRERARRASQKGSAKTL